MYYVGETLSGAERLALDRHFTNLDGPVFALVDLPEVVKGALFARYSRSPKSLRRLFLDEFAGDLGEDGGGGSKGPPGRAAPALRRAEALYDRVLGEYGDDSVAQLGGVHLACEQASNLLTKVLERGRLMAYLEQSTRYLAYDTRLGGRYRYWRDPAVLESPLGARYVGDLDALFDAYGALLVPVADWVKRAHPKAPGDSDLVHRRAVKARALDAVRGLLPAASLSNVGIYGSGQAYEALILRMRASALPEARAYSGLMLEELRKVIPSFLRRLDRPERGGAWAAYLRDCRERTTEVAHQVLGGSPPEPAPPVTLVDFDPQGEDKVLGAMLYPVSELSEPQLAEAVRRLGQEERTALVRAYIGDRSNRRHKPGRAFERTSYRFDVLGDYGAFRDLQRHRMLTIDWQALSPAHGYVVPADVVEAGESARFEETLARSASLYDALTHRFPAQAPYALSLAFRVRFVMQMNAREAMHVLELRTSPQGHPEYRRICQEMHRLIAEVAGHRVIAAAMSFVDHTTGGLGRIGSERATEARRADAR